jgi:hypothetical protein
VYDVWAEAGTASRARAAAAVRAALGVGLPAARDLIASDQPIARDVKAQEVQRLARALRPAGFGVRVDPQFRWTLP